MKLTIYGAGYVGLVSGICLAELGHHVCCMDIDEKRINMLKNNQTPIYEEGLELLLAKNNANGRLIFTADAKFAVDFAEVQMIAVGTPSKDDGSSDLRFVEAVARNIGRHMESYKLIVNKSTVLMGTADRVFNLINEQLVERETSLDFDVASNPEFLREGCAVTDFMRPDRIVVGTNSQKSIVLLQELYQPLIDQGYQFIPMKVRSAELTKYAANAFLATKISFINEMSRIAELFGADIKDIQKGLGTDARISDRFLNAGCGFGGSCFPKDVSALKMIARQHNYDAPILQATLKTNEDQQRHFFNKIYNYFNRDLKNKTVALWGLAFKPNTDDIRYAPALAIMQLLWEQGAQVQAYDPLAMKNVAKIYGKTVKLTLCDNKEDALKQADALLILTEWEQFKSVDYQLLNKQLTHRVIFDGRNLFTAEEMHEHGLQYIAVGCGEQLELRDKVEI